MWRAVEIPKDTFDNIIKDRDIAEEDKQTVANAIFHSTPLSEITIGNAIDFLMSWGWDKDDANAIIDTLIEDNAFDGITVKKLKKISDHYAKHSKRLITHKKQNSKGFGLVELMIVIAIIALLASMIIQALH